MRAAQDYKKEGNGRLFDSADHLGLLTLGRAPNSRMPMARRGRTVA